MVVSINKVSSTVSNVVQKGKSVASSEVVHRTITPQDKYYARTYLHAKTLDFKTTPEEINALFKFDDEFLQRRMSFSVINLQFLKN